MERKCCFGRRAHHIRWNLFWLASKMENVVQHFSDAGLYCCRVTKYSSLAVSRLPGSHICTKMTYNRFIISRLVPVIVVVASNTLYSSAIEVEQSSVEPDGKEGNTQTSNVCRLILMTFCCTVAVCPETRLYYAKYGDLECLRVTSMQGDIDE